MRYILVGLVLLALVSAADACDPANITCARAAMGAIYQEPGGLWAREYGYLVKCGADTLETRIVTIRWEGAAGGASAGLLENANRLRDDLRRHWQRHVVNWERLLGKAIAEIDDDLYEAMGVFISALRGIGGTPTPQQALAAWNAAHASVTWIDSEAYLDRLAAKFGMTRAQLLDWVIARLEWL